MEINNRIGEEIIIFNSWMNGVELKILELIDTYNRLDETEQKFCFWDYVRSTLNDIFEIPSDRHATVIKAEISIAIEDLPFKSKIDSKNYSNRRRLTFREFNSESFKSLCSFRDFNYHYWYQPRKIVGQSNLLLMDMNLTDQDLGKGGTDENLANSTSRDIWWQGDDVALLELIYALFESNSIEFTTRKEAINTIGLFFDVSIKNPDQKINQTKKRKNGNECKFLDKMIEALRSGRWVQRSISTLSETTNSVSFLPPNVFSQEKEKQTESNRSINESPKHSLTTNNRGIRWTATKRDLTELIYGLIATGSISDETTPNIFHAFGRFLSLDISVPYPSDGQAAETYSENGCPFLEKIRSDLFEYQIKEEVTKKKRKNSI